MEENVVSMSRSPTEASPGRKADGRLCHEGGHHVSGEVCKANSTNDRIIRTINHPNHIRKALHAVGCFYADHVVSTVALSSMSSVPKPYHETA